MDQNSQNNRRLIQAHLDQNLSDAEFTDLQNQLENDPALRAIYVEMAQLDAGLRDVSPAETEAKTVAFPRQTFYRPALIAAALALIALPIWLLLKPTKETATVAAATEGVAVISAEAGAVWKNSISLGEALPPQLLTLEKGLAQIDFFGGASVSLSAPAQLDLLDRDSAILHSGKLRADVPPAARGFEIRTGKVLLEDLGTSFGISTEDGKTANLIVFDGQVRATGSNGKPILLEEGDSADLDSGIATLVDEMTPETEYPDINDVLAGSGSLEESRYTSWKDASLDRKRDPRLIAYYDFENLTAATRRLRNQALHGTGSELDGGIVGARITEGRWQSKTAIDFRSEGDRVRFQIPGEFDELTIYAWVRIDALDRHLNSLFLTDYFNENEIHWQISRRGALHFAVSPEGVVDLQKHNRRFYSDIFWTPSQSGQWFCLATTAVSGPRGGVTHYINGEAVGFSGGTNREKPLPRFRIGQADLGNWSDPIWPDASIRTLNGRIDEFAIYSKALTATEIAAIYEQGKP